MMLGKSLSAAQSSPTGKSASSAVPIKPIQPPASGPIRVAFVVSEGANVMDLASAWEVFNETMLTAKGKPWHEKDGLEDMSMPFETYTVSESTSPVQAGWGLMIVPNYSFANAPKPHIIVIPAQKGRTQAQKDWLLSHAATSDLTMSVCTGADVLAHWGMLDGMTATTHHLFEVEMQKQYPSVRFVSGVRFVDHGKIATAGGLTSGIDLALHVVARYYGQDVAKVTANTLEYRGDLWKDPKFDEVKPVVVAK